MTIRPSDETAARDPFSTAFATWSRSVSLPFTAGFGTVCAPFSGPASFDATAPIRAAFEMQRAMLNAWLGLFAMPLQAVARTSETVPETAPAPVRPPAPAPAPLLIEALPAPVEITPPEAAAPPEKPENRAITAPSSSVSFAAITAAAPRLPDPAPSKPPRGRRHKSKQ